MAILLLSHRHQKIRIDSLLNGPRCFKSCADLCTTQCCREWVATNGHLLLCVIHFNLMTSFTTKQVQHTKHSIDVHCHVMTHTLPCAIAPTTNTIGLSFTNFLTSTSVSEWYDVPILRQPAGRWSVTGFFITFQERNGK